MIIDWKKIASKIYDDIKTEVEWLKIKPKLSVILVWNNSASIRYVAQKEKWAEYTWIEFELISLEETITEKELINKIEELNNNDSVSWFIVQLPLPKQIDSINILNKISPSKDVDGFHPENQWKIVVNDPTGLAPCTPKWVMEIFKHQKIDLKWKNIAIIGSSNIVWKPMASLLMNQEATVTVCNSKTDDISKYTSIADIVITATWVPWLITKNIITDKTIVIDVWFTVVNWKIFWDADFEDIEPNWNLITPVPGWVWALTVALLMKNTLQAYTNQKK